MSDYQVEIKLKNARLLKLIADRGFKSLSELARAAKVKPIEVCDLVNLKQSPLNRKNEFSVVVEKLAEALKCLPEDMFTDAQIHGVLETNKRIMIVSECEIENILQAKQTTNIDTFVDRKKAKAKIDKCLQRLPPQLADIIMRRFYDEESLAAVGRACGVTVEAARQMELRALRRLQHAGVAKKLRPFLDAFSDC